MTPCLAFGLPAMDLFGFVGLLLIIVALVFVVTCFFQWLWNVTVPEIFNLPLIRFWQAFRLLLLAGILFGAFPLRYSNNNSTIVTPPPPAPNIYIGQPPYELKK